MKTEIRLTEIRDILEKEKINNIYPIYINWIKTLLPFWKEAVIRIGELKDFDQKKLDKHLSVIENSFSLMEDWRFERIKYIKARRNEIDSAISFIRNRALDKEVSKYYFAPICRNVASLLRISLYISTHGYGDDQIPTCIAQAIYELSFCHVLLPFDTSDFIWFLPKGASIHTDNKDDLDNYHMMIENAGKKFEIMDAIQEYNNMAVKFWRNFEKPIPWNYPKDIFTLEFENISKNLHYSAINAFHNK